MTKQTSKYENKHFSIIGDSISTYIGFNPPDCEVFYDAMRRREAGILSVGETWWGRVIDALSGRILINDSFSGSTVCSNPLYEIESYSSSDLRTGRLHDGDIYPDVIMILMGINDWYKGEALYPSGEKDGLFAFSSAYSIMLKKLKGNYPSAEIWCLTLPISRNDEYIDERRLMRHGRHIDEFSEAIRECAKEQGARLINLTDPTHPFATFEGSHPSYEGMGDIASLVLSELRKFF